MRRGTWSKRPRYPTSYGSEASGSRAVCGDSHFGNAITPSPNLRLRQMSREGSEDRLLGHDHLATTKIYFNLSPEHGTFPLPLVAALQVVVSGERRF